MRGDMHRRQRGYEGGMADGMAHMQNDGLQRNQQADPSRMHVNPNQAMQSTAKRGRTPGTKVIKTCTGCQKEIAAALTKCPHCEYVYRHKKEKGTRSGKRGRKLCPSCRHENPAATASCKQCDYKFRLKISERYGKNSTGRPAPIGTTRRPGETVVMNGSAGPPHNAGIGPGYANIGGGLMAGANYAMGNAPANAVGNPQSYGMQSIRGHHGFAGIQGQTGMHSISGLGGGGAQPVPTHGAVMGTGLSSLAGLGGMQQLPAYNRGGGNEQELQKYDVVHGGQHQQRYHG